MRTIASIVAAVAIVAIAVIAIIKLGWIAVMCFMGLIIMAYGK